MTSYMEFNNLPAEILCDILSSVESLDDLLSLSRTSHRIHNLFKTRKLQYLTTAISAQYGPLEDAVQLITYNDSQPAHAVRSPPLSQALLEQVVYVGKVAVKWEDIYPSKRWDEQFESRRLLSPPERFALRRAIYRLWLYAEAFHSPRTPRHARLHAPLVEQRRMLLRGFDMADLAEMFDMHTVLRKVLESNVCPSNRNIEAQFRRRFPDSRHQLMFNAPMMGLPSRASPHPFAPPMHGALAGFGSALDSMLHEQKASRFRQHTKYRPTMTYDPGFEGWGDDIGHYYVIEDMMKLNPEQVLWLMENTVSKSQVQAYVAELGSWFDNNGETFRSTLDMVIDARGSGNVEFWTDVDYGFLGVAKEGISVGA